MKKPAYITLKNGWVGVIVLLVSLATQGCSDGTQGPLATVEPEVSFSPAVMPAEVNRKLILYNATGVLRRTQGAGDGKQDLSGTLIRNTVPLDPDGTRTPTTYGFCLPFAGIPTLAVRGSPLLLSDGIHLGDPNGRLCIEDLPSPNPYDQLFTAFTTYTLNQDGLILGNWATNVGDVTLSPLFTSEDVNEITWPGQSGTPCGSVTFSVQYPFPFSDEYCIDGVSSSTLMTLSGDAGGIDFDTLLLHLIEFGHVLLEVFGAVATGHTGAVLVPTSLLEWAQENLPIGSYLVASASPVDIIVTNPDGRSLGPTGGDISGGVYVETDLSMFDDLKDVVIIEDAAVGLYEVEVLPEGSGGQYSLIVIDRTAAEIAVKVLADGKWIQAGESAMYSDFAGSPRQHSDCVKGGFRAYGFKNQGQCVSFVRTGRDNRNQRP